FRFRDSRDCSRRRRSPAPPDFCKLAEAYGIAAERLAGTGHLADALKRARATGLPYVIEITID
ncbi:MAG: hypothetical protein EOS82_31530, partial [Mesorhizobium sp.]|uniref:thiamine pyrophosphate-dependent enzyme n=1 Tax=Mesorhizobium sp. TaxID=1871066 RepID=UPI000FE59852